MQTALLILLGAAVVLLLIAILRFRRRRWGAAVRNGLSGLLLLVSALVLTGLAANLHTYSRLTHEQDVAEIAFRSVSPARFVAVLERLDKDGSRSFEIQGDEWQIDARIVKWHGVGVLLGLDTRFRLERLSGRYADVDRENTEARTVYSLAQNPGVDFWQVSNQLPSWLSVVDAQYGSAAYVPMSDGARYRISVTQSGLVARPVNEAARVAVDGWK